MSAFEGTPPQCGRPKWKPPYLSERGAKGCSGGSPLRSSIHQAQFTEELLRNLRGRKLNSASEGGE